MARFKLQVCSASRNHSTRHGTVIADQRTHLDEQTLATGGYKEVGIKWNLSDAKHCKWQHFGRLADNRSKVNFDCTLLVQCMLGFQLTVTRTGSNQLSHNT